jgi:serine/threonine protein kinase
VRERFLREARAAGALRHPNVAAVYQFGTVPELDRCYYAMELVEGETLEARVRREGPLKVGQVLEIGEQVTRALIAAAHQGLIHRETPYLSLLYFQIPVTPALLRLDPIWDPLRGDPAFQKLCEEKQP